MSKFYNNLKTALLLAVMTGLILWIGSFFGNGGLIFALILAGVMNLVGYFFSDKIAIASVRAREVGPDHMLHRIVAELARRANLPIPRVYVSPMPAPNAFATGRNPKHAAVCATQGLLDMLDPHEVAAVMAHEMAHVKHRDILITSVAVTIGGAISMLSQMFVFGGGRSREGGGGGAIEALAMLLLGPLAAAIIQSAISRSREFNADSAGAELVEDPMSLATALEKIHHANRRIPMDVNPALNSLFIAEPTNVFRAVGNLLSTHPPIEKRLMNLIGRESTGLVA